MAWRCQVEPYLKALSSKVTRCEAGELKIKNGKQKGWRVELEETVFFPEGGGQPGDSGTIRVNDKTVNVIYTFREGESAIHFCDEKVEPENVADLSINWTRRFDHMQQHSGQHLISAIFERPEYAAETTSWNLGDEISFVEFSRPVTDEEIATVEKLCNEAIRNSTPITVEIVNKKNEGIRGSKELPADFAGPIRVVNIEGIDQNMCCGTHVKNLSDVQAIKLLHGENGKKGKGIVWFVAGERVFNILGKSWNVQRSACAKMSCQSHQLSDRIDKMSLNVRQTTKDVRNFTRELAEFTAKQLENDAKNLETKVIRHHRKDVGPDFLTACAENLKHLVDDGFIIMLSCGEQKIGNIIILGGKTTIDLVSKDVMSLLDAKGNAKNGRIQAKVNNLNNLSKAYSVISQNVF